MTSVAMPNGKYMTAAQQLDQLDLVQHRQDRLYSQQLPYVLNAGHDHLMFIRNHCQSTHSNYMTL